MRTFAVCVFLFASPVIAAETTILRDVAYVEPKSERQSLDVYAPASGSDHPIVVWIHGGGCRQGDKRGGRKTPQSFLEEGCDVVSPDYCFVPQAAVQHMPGR